MSKACCAVAEAKGWLNALKHRDRCEDSDCPCWFNNEEHYEEPTPVKIELPSIDLENVPIGTNVMKGTK